jgi:multidrug efflux pump subunit AcrA (membrane-fusion protein)
MITVGLPAELLLNEERNRKFDGVTVRTAGAVDPVARTMRVEVDVKNPAGELLAGAYAQVRFRLTSASPSYTLPGNALLFRPDGVHAASVDANNRVKLLPITLGTDYGTRVSIASGLNGDERVIVNPPDSIIDGAAVRIGRAGSSDAASGGAAKAEGSES